MRIQRRGLFPPCTGQLRGSFDEYPYNASAAQTACARSNVQTIIVFTLVNGAIYALLASGMNLIFGAARMINLVHTAFAMLAAYGVFFLTQERGLGVIESSLMAVVAVTILGLLVYQGLLNRVRQHPQAVLLITMALAMAFQELMILRFTSAPKLLERLISGSTVILGVRVVNQHLLIVGAAALIILLIWLLLTRTRLGIAIRATADDAETANLMGISTPRTLLVTMGIGTALAAAAGVFMGPLWTLTPFMWLRPMTMVLVIIVLGGLGSLKGSIIGAFIIALVESLVYVLMPAYSYLSTVFALLVMAVMLVVRPGGLFGVVFEEERL